MIRSLIRELFLLSDRLRQRAEARRLTSTQTVGRIGEDLAHRYLEERGMQIVARNWMPPGRHCEIDLVARDGELVVFVEVKSRRSSEFGDPERNIDRIKLRALRVAAASYIRIHRLEPGQVRFDLVTVLLADPPEIRHAPSYFAAHATGN